jgi:hypothetical protein
MLHPDMRPTHRLPHTIASCQLKYPLKGDSTVLKEARDLLLRRLENLDRERVKAIFAAARFRWWIRNSWRGSVIAARRTSKTRP